MKKIILAFAAVLICTVSMAQPPMGGGGFPGGGGGFPGGGGGFPGGGMPPGMMMGMFGMDASTFSSVEVAKAQAEAYKNMFGLTDKQGKKLYKVELKVADERYMDLLKDQSNNRQRGGGMPRGTFGPNMNGGFPGGGFPGGGMPGGMPPEFGGEEGEQQVSEQENVTSEDMLTDVDLLKKYDGIREKKYGKILTPDQYEKWMEYRSVRYERAKRTAERAAAMEAAAAAAGADGQQRPERGERPAGAPQGN